MPNKLSQMLSVAAKAKTIHPLAKLSNLAVSLEESASQADIDTLTAEVVKYKDTFPTVAIYDKVISELAWVSINVNRAEALQQAMAYFTYLRVTNKPVLLWGQYFDGTHIELSKTHIELARYHDSNSSD